MVQSREELSTHMGETVNGVEWYDFKGTRVMSDNCTYVVTCNTRRSVIKVKRVLTALQLN